MFKGFAYKVKESDHFFFQSTSYHMSGKQDEWTTCWRLVRQPLKDFTNS